MDHGEFISRTPKWNETQRIEALKSYDVLDSVPEQEFDDIVKLAADICGVPISLISLVESERQWFKAKTGVELTETPIGQSICAKAMLNQGVTVIPDTTLDTRSDANPLVTGVPKLRFYAGALLETKDKLPLGMLCVLDYKPNNLNEKQTAMLQSLARQVMTQLELRKALKQKEQEKKRYYDMFTSIDQAFCVIEMVYDADGKAVDYRFVETNPAFDAHTGLSNAVGKTIRELAPDIEMEWIEIYDAVVKTGESKRFTNPAKSLEDRWFDVYAFPIGEATEKRIAIVFTDVSKIKEAERKLIDSEQQFRELADTIPQLAWMTDAAGEAFWFNKRWYDYTGTTLEIMRGRGWERILEPNDVARIQEKWAHSIKTGEEYEIAFRLRRHDGEMRWFLTRARPIKDDQGRVVRWFGTNTDIEDARRIESTMHEVQGYLGSIITSSDDAIISKDLSGNVTSWNKAAERIFGYTAEEMIGKPITVLVPPEKLHEEEKILSTMKTGDRIDHFETHRRHKDGHMVEVSLTVSPIRDTAGNVIGASKISRDITQQKMLETQARTAREEVGVAQRAMSDKDRRLSTALEAGQMGTWELEIDGLVLSCSQTCNLNYGLAADDYLTFERARDLVHDGDRDAWMSTIGAAIEAASDFEMEYRIMWADGSLHWIYVRGNCTDTANGKATRLSGVSINITDRKKLETEAREAKERAEEANLAKTEFLATMSHEIRTPMNAVIGLSNILAKSQPLSDKQQEYIKTLRMSADSLLGLINDLLDIAKIEAHSVELETIPFSVPQLVQETISMMNVRAQEKGLSFSVVQDDASLDTRQLLGDPTRLRQILLNLCSNAIKFTEKGGITIHVSCGTNVGKTKEMIHIAVKDTGIGIAANKVGDIFHKFTQADSSINRKYGGTGLGLAITKTLAEIMGGTIKLESEFGKGSVFTVSIPFEHMTQETVQPIKAKAVQPEKQAPAKDASQPQVLLVEDYEPNVLVAETFLESFGYAVDVASNGVEAIEKIKANHYIATLMDVQMHGMNGLEATQIVRAYEKQNSKPRTYIIGMTAHALVGDRERCLAVGMDDYIAKPFNPDKLEEMLGQLTKQAAAA